MWTDLEIVLFNNKNLLNTIKANKNRYTAKNGNPFIPSEDNLKDNPLVKSFLEDELIEDSKRKSLVNSLESEQRNYSKIYESEFDSHFILESLGLSSTSLNYLHIISLEDSLHVILNLLSSCNLERAKEIKNYKELSRSLVNLSGDSLDCSISDFINLGDDNLNNMLVNLRNKTATSEEFIYKFMEEFTELVNGIIEYIAFYLQGQIAGLSIRSFESGKVLFASQNPINIDRIELLSSGGRYLTTLAINSYERYNIPLNNFDYDLSNEVCYEVNR